MGRRVSRTVARTARVASLLGAMLLTQLGAMPAAHAIVLDGAIDDAYTGRFVSVPTGAFTGRLAVLETTDAYYVVFEQDRRAKSNAYCEDKRVTPDCRQVFQSLVGSDYISLTWTIGARTIFVPVDILSADPLAPSGYRGTVSGKDGGVASGIPAAAVQGRSSMDHNLNGLGWRNFLNSPNFSSTPTHPYVYASQIEVRLDKTLGSLASGLDLSRPIVDAHNSPEAAMPPMPPATITTTSTPSGAGVAPGTSVRDVATVTGLGGPGTGTVTFFLCNPAQTTSAGCPSGGTQIGSPVALASGSATSAATTATTAVGTYCWRAAYSGDGTLPAASHTNATSECFTVQPVPELVMSTTSSPTGGGVLPGTAARDTATLTGNLGMPTGTVTFFLCGPAQTTAAGCPTGGGQIGGAVTLSGGTATSPSTTVSAIGTHCWRAVYSGDATYATASHTNATSECFTVAQQLVSIATQSSPSTTAAPGTSATDSAMVSGSVGSPTGTVSFFLCGPSASAAGCATGGSQVGAPVALVAGSARSAGTVATSAPGWYCWRAEYSGDALYAPASHTNTTTECFEIRQLNATIETTTSGSTADQEPGTSVRDTARVSGSAGTPSGTVTFFLCAPADTTAAGCPTGGTQIGAAVALDSAGTAVSQDTSATMVPGRYCWRAAYSGDVVYASASHTNATSECFTIMTGSSGPLDATLETVSDPSGEDVLPGSSVVDHATVAGATGGVVPTGTVTFFLCGPTSTTVAGCPTGGTQIGGPVALDAAGAATSSATTSTVAEGRYCWRAEYSGDANYESLTHTNATTECFTTEKLTPSISTVPKPLAADEGAIIRDTALVSGGSHPTGTVRFALHGPGDIDCSGTPLFVSIVQLTGGRATSGGYETSAFGIYRWMATYSGDARHEPARHGCQEELVRISKVLGGITPNLPTTGVDATGLRLIGMLLLAAAAVVAPSLRAGRPARTLAKDPGSRRRT